MKLFNYNADMFSKKTVSENETTLRELEGKKQTANSDLDNTDSQIAANKKTIQDLKNEQLILQHTKTQMISDAKKLKFGDITEIDKTIQDNNRKIAILSNDNMKLQTKRNTQKNYTKQLNDEINAIKNKLKNLNLKQKAAALLQQMKSAKG